MVGNTYCTVCGQPLEAGCRFCPQCGRAVPPYAASGARLPPRLPMERPRQGRKIAGVCLALANNLNVDPNLVRVLWVVITLLGAVVFGVIAYLVAWILIPEAPPPGLIAPLNAPTVGPSI